MYNSYYADLLHTGWEGRIRHEKHRKAVVGLGQGSGSGNIGRSRDNIGIFTMFGIFGCKHFIFGCTSFWSHLIFGHTMAWAWSISQLLVTLPTLEWYLKLRSDLTNPGIVKPCKTQVCGFTAYPCQIETGNRFPLGKLSQKWLVPTSMLNFQSVLPCDTLWQSNVAGKSQVHMVGTSQFHMVGNVIKCSVPVNMAYMAGKYP